MATNINQVLNPYILTGKITEVAGGVPKFCPDLPELDTKIVKGSYDLMRFLVVKDTRQTAPQRPYGSPATQANQIQIRDKQVTLPSYGPEYLSFKMQDLRNLMGENGQYMQDKGVDEITRQSAQFGIRYGNNRQVAKAQIFANHGKIFYDSTGNFATTDQSGSGGLTIDMGVPSGNIGACGDAAFGTPNLDGTTSTGYWDDPNTPILFQIAGLKRQSLKTSGLMLDTILYGAGIPTLLKNNKYVRSMIDFQGVLAGKFALGEIPANFLGIKNWIPVYEWFFEDSTGTNQSLIPDNFVGAIPGFESGWYGMGIGQTDIPANFMASATSLQQMMANVRTVDGIYEWAYPILMPLSLQLVMGDCSCPLFLNQNAPFFPGVTA